MPSTQAVRLARAKKNSSYFLNISTRQFKKIKLENVALVMHSNRKPPSYANLLPSLLRRHARFEVAEPIHLKACNSCMQKLQCVTAYHAKIAHETTA